MNAILLTQYGGSILGPIAKVLGWIMNGIFWVLDKIGIPNIGLAIIIFTIVIYLLLMPFTIKQQKFSKLSAKMNPELQAIQAYDVWKEKKNYGKVSMGVVRTTYLIDEQGIIIKAFGKVKAAENPAQMLEEL